MRSHNDHLITTCSTGTDTDHPEVRCDIYPMESCIFPTELVLRILDFCDKSELKIFRQCCRELNDELTPILFEELVVVPYASSIEGVTKLSFNPQLQHAVKRIRYDTNCLFDPSVTLEQAGKDSEPPASSKQLQHAEYKYPGFYRYVTQLQNELFRPPVSNEFKDSLYVSSNGWIMSDSGSELNLLSYLPYFFPQVEEITLSSKGWSNEIEPDHAPPPLPYFYQRWFQSHKRDSRIPDLDLSSPYFSNGGPEVVTCRAQCLLLALCNHSQRKLAIKMDGIMGSAFTADYSDDITEIYDRDCLRNCRSLEIEFFEQKDGYYLGEKYDGLAYVLAQNPYMEELTLQFNDGHDGPQQMLQQILSAKRLPPLRHITLDHLTVSGNTLTGALGRFKSTLKTLKLDTIRLRSGLTTTTGDDSWTVVLKTLADEMSLEDIELDGMLRGYRQDWTVHTNEELHEDWQRRASTMYSADRMAALQRLFEPKLSAGDLSQLVFQFGTDETVLFDDEDCLSARVRKFVTGQGEYPQELLEFEAIAGSPSGRPVRRPRPIGDYSMRMVVSM